MTKILFYIAFLLITFITSAFAQSKIEKLFYEGDYELTLELIQHKIEKGNAIAPDYQLAAKCNLQLFNYQSANANYEKALAFDSTNLSIVEALADVKIVLGFKKEALQSYNRILEVDTTKSRIAAKKASLLMDFNRYAEAESIYQKLYVSDSSNTFFLKRLMQARYKQKNYAYVIDLYWDNPYVSIYDKEVTMMGADAFHKVNNNLQALGILYNLLDIDSLYIPAISKIAYIQFSAYRNYDDAVYYYRILNELENYSDPFHLKNLGICEYFVGNQEYSANLLDSLTNELSDDPYIAFYAGLSYNKLGNEDKAIEFLERAALIVIPAYTSDIYHHLGRAYAAKRMFQKAISTYQKVREYDPENYQVLYDIAVTYEEYNLNRTIALGFYQQFVKECTNERSSDLKYAQNRIHIIKEELFFDGE